MPARDSVPIDLTPSQLRAFEVIAHRALQLADPFPVLLTVDAEFGRAALRRLMGERLLTRAELAAVVELGEIGIRTVEALALIQNTGTAEQALNVLKAAMARKR